MKAAHGTRKFQSSCRASRRDRTGIKAEEDDAAQDQQFYVCVNDRRFTVPANGKQQMLPKPVAEILQAAIEAEYKAEDFADNIPNESGDDPRNHAI